MWRHVVLITLVHPTLSVVEVGFLPRHFISSRHASPRCDAGYGNGMTQADMMESDQLVLIDTNDRVVGSHSKRAGHTFSPDNPRGWLHRAFSCFLFDHKGRMLLTRRAPSKITFPNVWTNACCSHPLHGRVPEEVDLDTNLGAPGIKNAARRKLQHELGIDPSLITLEDFRFLGRFHYWAADVQTHGANTPWGSTR